MKEKNKCQENIYYLCREFLILLAGRFLSPLQLASHKYDIEKKKKERCFRKLFSKMILLSKNFDESDFSPSFDNYYPLFLEIYSKKESLTKKELFLLQEFGYALKEFFLIQHSYVTLEEMAFPLEQIEDFIEKKRDKRKK